MIYPEFLKTGDTIGVTAPSAGSENEIDINRLNFAKKNFEKLGYKIEETKNCRTNINGRSSNKEERAAQLKQLYLNNKVKAIIGLSGGEFLLEMLSYVDQNVIKNNIKWIQGFSDMTGLLFPITTCLDIATIYGNNFKTFGMNPWHKSLNDNINILTNKILEEKSYDFYENIRKEKIIGDEPYNTNTKVNLINLNKEKTVDITGRIVGGCVDVIKSIIGTKFDNVKNFIEKYKKDGIVWYFDNCELSSEEIIRTMWQFKEAGYFEYTNGILFGRSGIETSYYNISFKEAIKQSLLELNVPIILETDISHKPPLATIINGSIARVHSEGGKGSIEFLLK